MKSLKSIMIEYAQEHGGGLPLSAQEICNSVVLWVQQYLNTTAGISPVKVAEVDGVIQISLDNEALKQVVKEAITTDSSLVYNNGELSVNTEWLEANCRDLFFNAFGLADLLAGSETVVVDVNETGGKVEIHLDGEILAKLNRAILTPLTNPTEDSVPVVGSNGAVGYKALSGLGGGGTKLYKHEYRVTDFDTEEPIIITFISTDSAPVEESDDIQGVIVQVLPIIVEIDGSPYVPLALKADNIVLLNYDNYEINVRYVGVIIEDTVTPL